MTLLRSSAPEAADALRLLSAIGDAFGLHRAGFGERVACTAARFALHRGLAAPEVAATYYAALLHDVGTIAVVVPPGTSERRSTIAGWDVPTEGARIAAGIPGLPPGTSDLIRWHRESFDGTGYPDMLRWSGIPFDAMAINVARAFVEAVDAQGEHPSPPEALFTLMNAAGRTFAAAAIRSFRAFFAAAGADYDADVDPAWPLDALDPVALVTSVCAAIDARDERTAGRGERRAAIAAAIASHAGAADLPDDPAFAARLTALAQIGADPARIEFDPLARLGRETRAAGVQSAAALLAHVHAFRPYAGVIGASEEWYDGSGLPHGLRADAIPLAARILAVANAAAALGTSQALMRLPAAAGTQLDPQLVRAYAAAVRATA
jgi:HD-GYP domain-containing protein (c-di-GMP phosphodiesterase class II)